jgi:hypothetical protein
MGSVMLHVQVKGWTRSSRCSWVRVVRDNFLFFTRVLVTLTLQEALLAPIVLIVELF